MKLLKEKANGKADANYKIVYGSKIFHDDLLAQT